MANYTYSQGSIDVIYPPNEKKTYTSTIVEPGCDAPPPVPVGSKFASLVDGSITEVTAEDLADVTEIREYAFYRCKNLTDFTIPSNITHTNPRAFDSCSNLTTVTILNGITTIGIGTFYACSKLKNIVIPASVTKIYENAFEKCSSLISIALPPTITSISQQMLYDCVSLESLIIPEGIKWIYYNGIGSCYNLKDITLPSSMMNLDEYALIACGSKTTDGTTITILAATPPVVASNTFLSAKIKKIIVPAGTGDTYKAATNWSALADYIEEATE